MRAGAFVAVAAVGFVVQMVLLTLLTRWWPIVPATAVAVEAAVLTNFVWHERWTWGDRLGDAGGRLGRLARFHVASGLTSVVGNTAITSLLVTMFDAYPVVASGLAVAALGAVNYVTADRWVFSRKAALMAAVLLVAVPPSANAAEPTPDTMKAWERFVAATELEWPQHEEEAPLREAQGRAFRVPGGTIHQWRGSIIVPGTTVDRLVDALLDPAAMPRQEDVADVRLLSRDGDALRVYMRLVRKMIVTVTYDTEHDVRYVRRSPRFATSRSVSTRIAETGGSDRGFLWRLNSYWRYRQVGDAVQVDVLSLSLSRDVPRILKPVADPIVERIGRESMARTLATVAATAAIPGRSVRTGPAPAR